MKNILITGANSYIGVSFSNWLAKYPDEYKVDTVDTFNEIWKQVDFTKYDVVFHVAGIAHIKETKRNEPMYYKVNRDLPFSIAQYAKEHGVKQFIFMSSMSVYGMEVGVINKETIPNPKTQYGKSKIQAEEILKELADYNFKLSILRPPLVYGKGCKGNFQTIIRFIKKVRVFPLCNNQRSMIYIDNLSSFVKLVIDRESTGIFFPQNRQYVQTIEIAKCVANVLGINIYFSILAGLFVKFFRLFLPIPKKAFGSLIYKDTEDFQYSYCVCEFLETIEKSV